MGARTVWQANGPQEALTIAASERIDLMLCGLNFTVKEGQEFLDDLAALGLKFSIVLTGPVNRVLLASLTALGLNLGLPVLGSLEKPIAVNLLQEMLDRQWHHEERAPSEIAPISPQDMLRGLENQEFFLYYQPIVSIKNRALVACEALLRWQHPEFGLLRSSAFLHLMDHPDINEQVTLWVFERGLKDMRRWMEQGLWLGLYVNLSERFLNAQRAANKLLEVACDYVDIEPRLVTFDVTESSLIEPTHAMVSNLSLLRAKGFGLALDSYSACTTVEQVSLVPFSDLKMTPSLLTGSEGDGSGELLAATLKLARELDLVLVAEGIERSQDWELVSSIGCHLAQGYLISRPMDARKFLQWAQTHATDRLSGGAFEARMATGNEEAGDTETIRPMGPTPGLDFGPSDAIRVGGTLGPYRLDALLGQGGLGKVFLAVDTRLLRRVAVKVGLHDDLSDESRKRFVREARALARVQHPGVVTIYEIGMEPCYYIVMEVLEGMDLERVLRKRVLRGAPLAPAQAQDYAIQMLEALAAVHVKGIIHRDLKPSNIMLGKNGRLKIMDFGIAKILEEDPKLTQPGQICGTPQYLSPEQIDVNLGGAEMRSDLFAVGTILYEMLTGQHTVILASLSQILSQLLLRVPPSPHEVNPFVPRTISDVCMKALEKDKERRYPSAEAFLAALKAIKLD